MRIEFYPTEGKEGFEILFSGLGPSTVEEIKKFSTSILAGMGYAIEKSQTKEGEGFYFFTLESTNDEKIKAKDLLYSLVKATRNIDV